MSHGDYNRMLLEDNEEYLKKFNSKAFYKKIDSVLQVMPEVKDAYAILDCSIPHCHETSIPREDVDTYTAFEAFVETSGSTGLQVTVKMCFDDTKVCMGTMRTCAEGLDAYVKMGQLAGAVTYLADIYLWLNF